MNKIVRMEEAPGDYDEVQLVNYLVAIGIDEGLVLNFGAERLEFKKKFRRPKQQTASLNHFVDSVNSVET
jgi:hypothetical protein